MRKGENNNKETALEVINKDVKNSSYSVVLLLFFCLHPQTYPPHLDAYRYTQEVQFSLNLHLQEMMLPYLFLLRFSSSLAVSQDAVCPSGKACKINNSVECL